MSDTAKKQDDRVNSEVQNFIKSFYRRKDYIKLWACGLTMQILKQDKFKPNDILRGYKENEKQNYGCNFRFK